MEDIRLTYNDIVVYAGIVNTVLGLLFGIFPLVVGIKNNNKQYAYIGLIGSIIGGFVLSVLLAFPIALIFTMLSLRSPRSGESEALSVDDPGQGV